MEIDYDPVIDAELLKAFGADEELPWPVMRMVPEEKHRLMTVEHDLLTDMIAKVEELENENQKLNDIIDRFINEKVSDVHPVSIGEVQV